MNDEEKIQNFADMVEATEKLTKPWRVALFLTNILWAAIVALLVTYAYLVPVEMEQLQDFPSQRQNQSYTDGATFGN